jgi:hypothetical protein
MIKNGNIQLFGCLLMGLMFMVGACNSAKMAETPSGDTPASGPGVDVGNALITWGTPTQYDNGSDLIVAGYKVYYGTVSGVYTGSINIATNETFDASSLLSGTSGTFFFAITAYDDLGSESDYSAEVSGYISVP